VRYREGRFAPHLIGPSASKCRWKGDFTEYPADRVDEIIDEHGVEEITENKITDRETLRNELNTIRDQNYVTDEGN
jgi:hypothetical protein